MRILFLLLVLANVAFFAWDRYVRVPISPQEHIRQVQMTPEKIKLAKDASPPSPAMAAAPAPAVIEAGATPCLEWGAFIGAEVARVEGAIVQLGVPAARVKRVVTDARGYWVLIPPLPGKAEIDKTLETLKAQGIAEYTLVAEPPQKRNAISLGMFRTEDAARNLLTVVKQKGINDAVIEPRENFFKQAVFYIREPGEAVVGKLAALRAAYPGSEVKAVACPGP